VKKAKLAKGSDAKLPVYGFTTLFGE